MKVHRIAAGLVMSVALLALWPARAVAQGPEGRLDSARGSDRGVSEEEQEAARALFLKGNALLDKAHYKGAIEQYRKALEHWDHPAIHYNLALALQNFDQPLELYQHLRAATREGSEPLGEQAFGFAQDTLRIIERQLARLEVTCAEPGAVVTLNGEHLFVAPGRHEELVRPGHYSIAVSKEGYFSKNLSRTLLPGEHKVFDLRLHKVEYWTRWPAWQPWAVLGAGAAVMAGGGLLHLQVRDSYNAFDAGIQACGGCVPGPGLADLRSRGDTLQGVSVGAYAVGGAAMVTGAVLLYLNQPQLHQPPPDEGEEAVSAAPLLGGGAGGVQVTIRF